MKKNAPANALKDRKAQCLSYLLWKLEKSKRIYGAGIFVAISSPSDAVVYSYDGIVWFGAVLPWSSNWCSVCYGAGKFVILSRFSGDENVIFGGRTVAQ